MNLKPEHIQWGNEVFNVKDLLRNNPFQNKHDKDMLTFLEEWYSPDPGIQVSTSGSTGTPKEILLDKQFVAQSALRTLNYFKLRPGDQVLHCLPMQFIAGKLMLVRSLLGNLKMITIDPSTDFGFLNGKEFKFAAMLTNQVAKLFDLEFKSWNIEHLLIGGAALPKNLETKLHELPGTCYSSYGMTETASHIAIRKIVKTREDDWYTCMGGITIQLSDKGCLQINMPGLNTPFLETTDLATIKDDVRFKISGRKDWIINSGGIKHTPEKIENKLAQELSCPYFIAALPHDSLGNQLVLVVEKTNDTPNEAQIMETCRRVLLKHEVPKQILFVKKIRVTSQGKLVRKIP